MGYKYRMFAVRDLRDYRPCSRSYFLAEVVTPPPLGVAMQVLQSTHNSTGTSFCSHPEDVQPLVPMGLTTSVLISGFIRLVLLLKERTNSIRCLFWKGGEQSLTRLALSMGIVPARYVTDNKQQTSENGEKGWHPRRRGAFKLEA
jgi:hypothetical protein